MFSLRKATVIASLIIFTGVQGVNATAFTPAGINKEARTIVTKVESRAAKAWITSITRHFADTLKTLQRYSYYGTTPERTSYKLELIKGANQFLNDLRSGQYTFAVTDTERKDIETLVISYQKDFATAAEQYMENYLKKDKKETGDFHFTFKSGEDTLDINIDSYRVLTSTNLKNIEVDSRITVSGSGVSFGKVRIVLDGNTKLIDKDAYITLRDATVEISGVSIFDEYIPLLQELKGKTYHKGLDTEYLTYIEESVKDKEVLIKNLEKSINVLRTESLLTPVGKRGEEFVLSVNTRTLRKIAGIFASTYSSPLSISSTLSIPAEIRTNGKQIHLDGFALFSSFSGTIDRASDATPIFTLDVREKGTSNPWTWQLSKTPNYWALAGAGNEGTGSYIVDAKATKNGATATVKKGNTVIATAKIDSNGLHAWSYSLSSTWDDMRYNWEKDIDESITTSFRLWGNIRDEFGTFTLTPPTLSEELDKLSYFSGAIQY